MFEPEAPEFKNIQKWFNSKPLSVRVLRGKILLIDFWTYSCVNCIHTLPHVKMLNEKYKDLGLVVIGVQTPEFEFEKNDENIQKAIEKYGITYPVANDTTNITWQLYGNKYWPRRTLVNGRGKIILEQAGEGGEYELEMKIIEALVEIGVKTEFTIEKKIELTRDDRLKVMDTIKRKTPEIYLGWERGEGFGNSAVCIPGSCTHFIDRGDHKDNLIYLKGNWTQEKERVVKEDKEEGYAVVKYTAREVNAVMEPRLGKKYRVYIFLDGKPLVRGVNAGRDVKIDRIGSYVYIEKPDMYELVETDTMQTHEIKLQSDSDEFTIYTFTFS